MVLCDVRYCGTVLSGTEAAGQDNVRGSVPGAGHVPYLPISLRAAYALSGTETAYYLPTRCLLVYGAMIPRAVCGTDAQGVQGVVVAGADDGVVGVWEVPILLRTRCAVFCTAVAVFQYIDQRLWCYACPVGRGQLRWSCRGGAGEEGGREEEREEAAEGGSEPIVAVAVDEESGSVYLCDKESVTAVTANG
eukprot:3941557-Rhodomonas_salina.1